MWHRTHGPALKGLDVTNQFRRDKGRKRTSRKGPVGAKEDRTKSRAQRFDAGSSAEPRLGAMPDKTAPADRLARLGEQRQQLLDLDRDAVAAHDHRAGRHRKIVGHDLDLIVL